MNAPRIRSAGRFLLEVAMRIVAVALSALVFSASAARAQTPYHLNPDEDRAQLHYRLGWEAFRVEHWDEAVKKFKQVLDVDAKYKLAYYGLGRSYMALKQFADATAAYERCRQLYEGDASEKFRTAQEADQIRQSDLDQLKLAITTLSSRTNNNGVVSNATQNQIRQLRDQAQRIQIKRDALNNSLSIASEVPAFVWLALGSAYFRSERLVDAERAYKAAVASEPKAGEAWSNLAVVYLATNRLDDAEHAVSAAEKVGFRVNENLKGDIRKKKSGG
jgi:tetratricopeptide (TPR) repeat protein